MAVQFGFAILVLAKKFARALKIFNANPPKSRKWRIFRIIYPPCVLALVVTGQFTGMYVCTVEIRSIAALINI